MPGTRDFDDPRRKDWFRSFQPCAPTGLDCRLPQRPCLRQPRVTGTLLKISILPLCPDQSGFISVWLKSSKYTRSRLPFNPTFSFLLLPPVYPTPRCSDKLLFIGGRARLAPFATKPLQPVFSSTRLTNTCWTRRRSHPTRARLFLSATFHPRASSAWRWIYSWLI